MKLTKKMETNDNQTNIINQKSDNIYIEKEQLHLYIKNITINSGENFEFSSNQLVVFVGPNNVGKSAALKDIQSLIKDPKKPTTVVKGTQLEYEGSRNFFLEKLDKLGRKSEDLSDKYKLPTSMFYSNADDIADKWFSKRRNPDFEILFTKFLSTEERLSVSVPPDTISLLSDRPTQPIHFLLVDDDFEKKFSQYFRQAFGLDLIVNKGAGNKVPLHVGTAPSIDPGEDRVHKNYLGKLHKLPTLDKQGDGMRSFVGVLLMSLISESILLIDEPEAFLHPPQAYLLGQMIAKDIPNDKQIFISTHSEDFLKGLLSVNTDRVELIRIQREGPVNTFSILNSIDIEYLWKDPLLRYSNILNGLFHSRVIVCESDGDCRFFGAMIDSITEEKQETRPDILFVHCGGKQRIPTVVNSLVKLNVKVIAVTDFDVLNDKSPLKEIYEGLGGTWSEIEADWKEVKRAVDAKKPELDSSSVKSRIDSIISSVSNETFPNAKAEEIRKVLKKANPWSEAKSLGKSYIPAGEPNKKATSLIDKCRSKGLHILEVGELECFDKSVGDHGPKWVNQVLEKNLASDPELEQARKFANQLLN